MYQDVNVIDIDSDSPKPEKRNKNKDATADINHFFEPVKHYKSKKCGWWQCKSCMYILTNNFNLTFNRNGVDGNNKIAVNLVDEHTTLQWHMASKHKVIEIFSFSYFVLF